MSFLQALDSSEALLLLLEATLKGSLVLAAAGLATSLLRRSPAAVRHTVWTTALVAVAVLPAIVAYAPKYDIGILPATESRMAIHQAPASNKTVVAIPDGYSVSGPEAIQDEPTIAFDLPHQALQVVGPGSDPAATEVAAPTGLAVPVFVASQTSFNWWRYLVLLWVGGVFVVALRYVVGWIALRRIRRRTEPVADVRFRLAAIRAARSMGLSRRVRLVWGASSGMPLTWGFMRPTVLLPQDAREWKPEKILAVLRHELAHIKRWDCLVQALVYFVCAVYWFNPLVWISAANSRKEREMACDDYVIRGGTAGTAYADHLLEIARSLGSPKMSGVSTIAMARPTELEGRLMAILSQDRHRNENTRIGLFVTMGFLTAVALPLAAVRPVPVEPDLVAEAIDFDDRASAGLVPLQEADPIAVIDPSDAFDPITGAESAEQIERFEVPRLASSSNPLPDVQSVEATRAYIEQANRLVEKAAKTLESIERLEPTLTEWQAEFGSDVGELLTPLILDQIIANPDTIPLAQIKRLKAAGVDAEYIEELASVDLTNLTVDELVSLAHAGVDAEYVLQLQNAGYRDLTPTELSQLGFADVEPEDIAVWAELGYDDLTTQDLIKLAHADVDARFVMAMAELGYRDLGPNDLTRMSHADVDPEFVAEMRRAGYSGLTADELIRLGHADIDAEFVREMGRYGLTDLSAEELIRLGHADVDAGYIEAMRSTGYRNLTADDLIRMSHADVDPDFVQELSRAGLRNLSSDELIRMGHAGIDAEYIAELRDAGLSNLTADDLVRLGHADVDADYIAEMKELGFDTSNVDELIRLKYMDIDTEYIKRIREAEVDGRIQNGTQ